MSKNPAAMRLIMLPWTRMMLLLVAGVLCVSLCQSLAPQGTRNQRSAKAQLVPIGNQVSRTRLELQKRASA